MGTQPETILSSMAQSTLCLINNTLNVGSYLKYFPISHPFSATIPANLDFPLSNKRHAEGILTVTMLFEPTPIKLLCIATLILIREGMNLSINRNCKI